MLEVDTHDDNPLLDIQAVLYQPSSVSQHLRLPEATAKKAAEAQWKRWLAWLGNDSSRDDSMQLLIPPHANETIDHVVLLLRSSDGFPFTDFSICDIPQKDVDQIVSARRAEGVIALTSAALNVRAGRQTEDSKPNAVVIQPESRPSAQPPACVSPLLTSKYFGGIRSFRIRNVQTWTLIWCHASSMTTKEQEQVIQLLVPAAAELPKDLFDTVPQHVPVIDTGNYYPGLRDPQIPEIDAGMAHSVWVSKQLGRPVIKAFNNILAYSLAELGRSQGSAGRLAIAVAGDDVKSKQIVMDVVNETGFDPVDAGSLDESWRQQPGTPAYCCDYDAETTRKGIAGAVKGEAPKKLQRLIDLYRQRGSNMTHEDMIAMNRSLNPLD